MKILKIKSLFGLFLMGIGLILLMAMFVLEDDEVPVGLTKKPLQVDVVQAQISTRRIGIPAWGFIEPREQVDILSQVAGIIVSVGQSTESGAYVTKGDILFSIDPRDYENIYQEAKAEVVKAEQSLEIEKGQQEIAKTEFQLFAKDGGTIKNNSLALREPQLKEQKAALAIATAQKNRAKLNLQRATLAAPCDGYIVREDVAIGKYMEVGAQALTLACTDQYHILANYSPQYQPDDELADVSININGQSYSGKLTAILPQIDPKTRQKQALIKLENASLPLGAYASVQLKGPELSNIIVLPRAALRNDTTVWVVTEKGTLDIRPIVLAAQNDQEIFIQNGLDEGSKVIISHIATPLKDMQVRVSDSARQKISTSQDIKAAGDSQ